MNYAIHSDGGKQRFVVFVDEDSIVTAVVKLNVQEQINSFGMAMKEKRFKSFLRLERLRHR